MTELLPCPFCGGEARTIEVARYGSRWGVRCPICGGMMCFYPTEAEAIEAWNTRAERTCQPLGTIRNDYEGGYAGFEYETELSCGHKWYDCYGDYPDYCPWCGAKVVEE